MILDASAILAMILREEEADDLLRKVRSADKVRVGAPTLVETTVVLVGRYGIPGHTALTTFLQEGGVLTVPFEERHWWAAEEAFIRFGKGRHPAGLNLGDCMSYAAARIAREPLLFVGDDFAKTDIPPA